MKKILFVILLSFVCFCCKGQEVNEDYKEILNKFNVNRDTLTKINICPKQTNIFKHLISYHKYSEPKIYEIFYEVGIYFEYKYNTIMVYAIEPKGYQNDATGQVYKDKESNYYLFGNGKCHTIIKKDIILKKTWYDYQIVVYTNDLPKSKSLK